MDSEEEKPAPSSKSVAKTSTSKKRLAKEVNEDEGKVWQELINDF